MEEISKHLTWRVVARRDPAVLESHLPRTILTPAPGFIDDRIPSEVALLLPNGPGNAHLLAAIGENNIAAAGMAFGLFLADPFLKQDLVEHNLPGNLRLWMCNLPSVVQQDPEFTAQLGDVGLDFKRELERLAAFARAGYRIMAVVSGAEEACHAALIAPDVIFVMPRVSDFAAGFPSFHQRGTAIAKVFAAANREGWQGPLLGLATASEARHETLWPALLSGVVTRPEAL